MCLGLVLAACAPPHPPVLEAVTPASGSALGGVPVTLTGRYFHGEIQVTFDGVEAIDPELVDPFTIRCSTPPGLPGALVDVRVANGTGQARLAAAFRNHELPGVESLSVAAGTALGGTVTTLTGSGFVVDGAGTNLVEFDGVPAAGVTVLGDTQITCVSPPGAAGMEVQVRVRNANGSAQLEDAFHYHPGPTLGGVSPPAGTSLGASTVVLAGTGFLDNDAGANLVTFDGVPAPSVVVESDTEITCQTPPGAAGLAVDVVVANANGAAGIAGVYAFHPVPAVTNVSPESGTSLGGTSVTIVGSGFQQNDAGLCSVLFGGEPASNVAVVDDATITCDAPAGAPGSSVEITVLNANGAGSRAAGFRFHAMPTVNAVSPTHGTPLGATAVTLAGTGFLNDEPGFNSVTFDGVAATDVIVVSDTSLTCTAPAGTPASTVAVAVANVNGSGSLGGAYRYHAGPTLTSVAPPSGPPVGGGTVTVRGSGFLIDQPGTPDVRFGGTAATNVVVVDDTQLTCTTPAGPDDTAVTVAVTTANGSASLTPAYIYHSHPVLAGVTPAAGTSLGGTAVTLFGAGFVVDGAGVNTVTFDGVSAADVVVVDDNTITCTTPPGTAGTSVLVQVVNANGAAPLANGYAFHPLPALSAVTPATGSPLGGTAVTLTGSGFLGNGAGTNGVTFGGVPATSVIVASDTSITCVTPAGTPRATVEVRVSNSNGAATLPAAFAYYDEPTLTGIAPASGSSLGGDTVTLTGTGFQAFAAGTNVVTFGGASASSVAVVDDSTLTCVTPAGTAGTSVDVRLSNANGASALTGAFAFHALPTLTGVSPGAGTSLGGTSVTLTGTGFQSNGAGANAVTFAGVAATSVVLVNDTTLTCLAPAGAAGTSADVRVSNANGAATSVGGFEYHALPTVTAVSPASGTSLGGTPVTVTGSGFLDFNAGTNSATFGGAAATSVVVVSDTALTCVTPAGTAGTSADLQVSNANGSATLAGGYAYHARPTLTAVSPSSGTSLGGNAVTLTGTGFSNLGAGTNTVTFGAAAATSVTVVSDTTITCVAPDGTSGASVNVQVSNSNGAAALASGYAYHALPTITGASPSSGTSLGGTTVTVTGTGFQSFSPGTNTVRFGGVAATSVVVVSNTSLTCVAPAGTAAASVDVQVSNANGSATLASGYAYHALPTITGASPSSGTSLGGTTVTVTGTGFQSFSPGTNTVRFGGVAATSVVVVSNTSLTCVTPAGTAAASVDVQVSNTNGTATLTNGFSYHALPTVASVTPAAGTSLGGNSVTVTGTGFSNLSPGTNTVRFGGVAATSVVVASDTTLTCVTPAGTAGATVSVQVTNANGSATLASAFSFHALPTVTAVSPASGTSLGGTSVTVTGTGFLNFSAGTNTVRFGGTSATSVVVASDTTLTCVTPVGTAGTSVNVQVTNANGSGTLASGYAYHARPTVTSVSPGSGTSLGGTSVTITGTGFTSNGAGTNTVTFGGVAATSVVAVSNTTLTCVTPAGTAGTSVTVQVANANGSGSLASGFVYHARPTVTGVTASTGTSLGGTSVTVTGTGFSSFSAGTNTVTFGGAAASSVTVVNNTTLTCVTPAGTAGTSVAVAVTNTNGTGTLSAGFTYFAAPTLSSVSPSNGSSLGGTALTLNGTGFVANGAGTNTVTIGGAAATNVVVVSNTRITCTAPAGTGGTAVEVVVGNANGSATLAGGYAYHARPIVTAVSPAVGSKFGGNTVTLTGTGFLANGAGTNGVTFGGAAATSVIVFSDTSITCRVPAGPAGTSVDVTVTNANGAGTLAGGYAYHAQPTVTAVTPASGTSLGGATVDITGTGFLANGAGAPTVTFASAPATGVVVISDTTIRCVTPAGTAGSSITLTVANANGSGALAAAYAYHARPTVASVSPAAGTALGGTAVTVTGTGFQAFNAGTCTVSFAGAAATSVVVVDDTTLTCLTPSGTAGAAVAVAVANANGSGTLAGGFGYHPAPTVSAVAPAHGRWQGGIAVTITGTGFQTNAAGTCTVGFGAAQATSVVVVNDTTITCVTPAGTPASVVAVAVSNANGSGSLSAGYRNYAATALTAVSPTAGTALGGTAVTLTGSGFEVDAPGVPTVTFAGAAATSVVVVNDATITCVTPAGTAGSSVAVAVANANGTAALNPGFTYHQRPAIFSLSPSAGSGSGGTSVTISGTGFQGNAAGTNTVTFGGVAAANVVTLNDTTITCLAPGGTPGVAVDVEISNANGSDVRVDGFTFHQPPGLASLAPASGTSLGGTTVSLTGTGFLDNAAGTNAVTFGGVAATEVVVQSDSSITCEAPAGTPGTSVDVVVTNGNGAGTLSLGYAYHPLPTVTAASPAAGTSLGGTAVTITGSGFLANGAGTNTVRFAGVVATNVVVVDDATITCTSPAGTAGTSAAVQVANLNGTATLSAGFAYHASPALTGVSPASGTSLGGTTVTLTGSGFLDNAPGANAVTFGGTAATSVVVVDDATLTCAAPARTPGSVVDVVLSNANGTATLAAAFRYHQVPTLTSVSPATGAPGGGTSVTLTGTGFLNDAPGTNTVTFGATVATNVVAVSDTSITCDAPAGTAGATVNVTVANANGSATRVNAFTFYPAPTLAGISPDHGPESGGTTVTLTGTGFLDNFAGTNTVTIGGVAATSVVVTSNTSLTCVTPALAAGAARDVVLANANGSATLSAAYTYNVPPTLTAVSPAAGSAQGGTSVTLTGTGFQANQAGANTVTIGGAALTSVVVVDDTTIQGLVPAGTAGASADVVVTNLNGTAALVGGYAYHAAPTLTAVTPDFGPAAGGTAVTLTGSGFLDNAPGTNSVTVGGLPVSNLVVVDDTTITCATPAGSGSSTVAVVVANENGTASLPLGFEYNDPPVVAFVPKAWAEEGAAFSYTPTTTDPDVGDTLLFSSTGTALPAWLTLDSGTGTLSGTPGPGHIGLTTGLRISVDDGHRVVHSNLFDLAVSGAATRLVFGTAPSASETQDEPWTAFTVRVEDAAGNLVGTWTAPITLALASGTGTLSGTLARTAFGGVASFTDVSYDAAEAITFDLSSPGLTGILGTAMTIAAGPAVKLRFTTPPAQTEYQDVVFSHFVVEVQDAGGSRITTDHTTQVDITLAVGTGMLSGTLSRTVTAGRAVFDDVAYDVQEAITLQAASVPATTTAVSGFLNVDANPPAGLSAVRASLHSSGAEGNAASAAVALSANGRFAAFESAAGNLVAGDTNGASDVFVRDRVSGVTTRVSVGSAGAEADGPSFAPAISADGRFVAFESAATNLVTGDTNGVRDVFVHDRQSGTTVRVSVSSAGAEADAASAAPAISASGRRIAFASGATNLVAGDTNAVQDVFVHDLVTGVTARVSVDSFGAQADGASSAAALAADGSTVAFHSAAANLVAGDSNAALDVFVHTLASSATARVSVGPAGAQAAGDSTHPSISSDGQLVAFASLAADLVAGDTNAALDVFVHDRTGGSTTRVSVSTQGVQGDGASDLPAISGDGDVVVFQSAATNLFPGDSEGQTDVFVRRRTAGRTVRVSTAPAGGGGAAVSSAPAISADAAHAAFTSAAVDLVAGDANGAADVFLRPLHSEPALSAVAPSQGTSLGGTSMTLTGAGFVNVQAGTPLVLFGGVAATDVSVAHDASLSCKTPAGTPGASVDVAVVTNNGVGTLVGGFTYRSTPSASSLSPTVGPVAGGASVTITGSGFTGTGFGSNSVTFGEAAATNVVTLNDTTITCNSPAGSPGATVDVTVTNANGSATLSAAFTYFGAPTLASIAPSSGHAGGGTTVTLTGTGFQAFSAGTNAVTFGGVAATNVAVVDDATITCTSPAGNPGTTVGVAVTNANGTATLAGAFTYDPVPVLASVSPAAGSPLGGTSVTLTGTGFQNSSIGATTVSFGGTQAGSVSVVDGTTITCTTPAGTAGSTVDVVVTNGNGASTLVAAFAYNPAPVLSAVSPAAGTSLGGRSVTLTGTGFQNGSSGTTTVTIGGSAAANVTVVNGTTITCDTPAGAAATQVDVVITNGNGASTLAGGYRYFPRPTLASASPAGGPLAGGTTITLSGTGFTANQAGSCAVTIGGNPATSVVVLNNTTLTCVTPAASAGGAVDIVLGNDNGSGTLAGGYGYTYAPGITSVAPAVGTSLGGTAVTVTGSGFVSGAAGVNTVTFDGVEATSLVVVNDTTITCITPAGAAGASIAVGVSNGNGSGALNGGFGYHATPTVTASSPGAGSSLGGTSVTLTGTGFQANDPGASSVSFGGAAATSVVVVNDTTLTCVAPAGTPAAGVDVTVSNANGSGTLGAGHAYHALPTVTAVTANAGSSLGGTSVTVTGTGFQSNAAGTNAVAFAAVAATSVVVVDDTTITCVTPAGTAGASVSVAVTNANGSGALADAFSYHPRPAVTAVSPGTGTSLGGTSVTLTGSGFLDLGAGANSVTFGAASATNVAVVSDTSLTCDAPAGAAGASVSVTVSNGNGAGTLAAGFAYHARPTVTAVSPATGSSLGGGSVTLTGTGFLAFGAGAAGVTFAGAAATNVTVVSDTSLTCDTPAGAAGATVAVAVTNANGTGTLAAAYGYNPTPTIASVSPGQGSPLGGTTITLSGTGYVANLAGTNSVTVDGVAATTVTVLDDNTLTCVTPAGTSGAVVDVVVSNANGSGTGAGSFAYNDAPVVTGIAPAAGTALGSTSVTITGSGFIAAGAGSNTVTFAGAAATNVNVVSNTSITCVTPAGTQGTAVDVVVTNANGSGTLTGGFAYHPAPTITSVSPSSATALGGTNVTVSGSGFTANSAGTVALTIGGAAPTNVVVVNDTTITCRTPAGTPGSTVAVQVTNNNGTGSLAGGFSYHPTPTLSAVTPATGTSLGGTALTLTGSGFQNHQPGTHTVTVGGAAASSIVVVDDATITCVAPAGTAGASVNVVVSNANGTATRVGGYAYHARPTVTSVSPAAGTALGGTSVTLTGTGFQDNAAGTNTVTFGAGSATSVVVVNDTTITCVTPAGTAGAAVAVTVSNANGTRTLAAGYAYHPGATISAVSPASGTSLGSTPVTITGTGFQNNNAGTNLVFLDGVAASNVAVVSDTSLTCTTPAGPPGTLVVVEISNNNGTVSLAAGFGYHARPTLTGVAPAAGSWLGGTALTLTGTGFQANGAGAATVTIGGAPATNVTVTGDTTITCTAPPGTPADHADVVVSNANGSATRVDGYHYHSDVVVDLDDDGVADLVVGAPGALGGDGEVRVFFGSALGITSQGAAAANLTIRSSQAGAVLGSSVAVGDLNGDGDADLIVGASGSSTVHVFFGPFVSGGPLFTNASDVTIGGATSTDAFGAAVAVGDVNGDQVRDLIVGAPLHGSGGEGAVYAFFGGTSFAPTSTVSANLQIVGASGEALGSALAIGDLDQDGDQDLVLGASATDRVHVFFGGAAIAGGTTAGADATFTGAVPGDAFGSAVAVADVSGDLKADLIVGAPGDDGVATNAGAVLVFHGGVGFTGLGAAAADTKVTGQAAGDALGSAVAAGDVDGDGTPDLISGAPLWNVDGTTTDVGRAYLFLGGTLSATMAAGAADAIYTGEANSGDRFGSVLRALDLDDDGRLELLVGAAENDFAGTAAGRAYVFLGTAAPLSTAASAADAAFTGAAAGDRFGAAIGGP